MLTASKFETVSLAMLERNGLKPSKELHRKVVMVVDDERIIADSRSAILRGWGYAVLTAYDAESALEIARVIPPELLVSDAILRSVNGVALAVAMKHRVPDCKVILFSGRAEGQDLPSSAENVEHGFTFLSKPVHPAHLWAHLVQMQFEDSVQVGQSGPN